MFGFGQTTAKVIKDDIGVRFRLVSTILSILVSILSIYYSYLNINLKETLQINDAVYIFIYDRISVLQMDDKQAWDKQMDDYSLSC